MTFAPPSTDQDEARSTPWHRVDLPQLYAETHSSIDGLSHDEAARRLALHGPNALVEAKRRTILRMFVDQLADFMILVLLGAAVVSIAIGEATDALAIMAIVVLNAIVGFVQEYRAERAMEALKAMAAPSAIVRRDGRTDTIPVSQLVPGDLVLLEAGTVVPADLRLVEVALLRMDEAPLTGESTPIEKTTDALPEESLPVGDRRNIAHKGTRVTYGRGTGVVVATGMQTEFGRIATLLQDAVQVRTPLQRRLTRFGQWLGVIVLGICAIVFATGLLRGEEPLLMFLTAVSLAVAGIPEALPAVVTIALALGARRMSRKHALVRKLAAVETLGSVTYICADKTGTLTLNRMTAEAWFCDGQWSPTPLSGNVWHQFLLGLALNNDVRTDATGALAGDPTEVALVAGAQAAGINKIDAERSHPRLAELPFDSDRKCMTTFHPEEGGEVMAFTKGAVEAVMSRCRWSSTSSGSAPLDPTRVTSIAEDMAGNGLRVLALAMRRWPSVPDQMVPDVLETDLTLLGLVGLIDPPREEAREAVATCKAAGIVPVMITGDHPMTARVIARRLGIIGEDDRVVSGPELAALLPTELEDLVEHVRVYARVAPEQKLAIVSALQRRGEFVAMTGDGVNDAPALKRADIGVAMGITGTDVAKEASAMVLLDDDFATIVKAVREGRKIYDNIRKFIKYTVTTNSGELWVIFLAPLVGLPIPLLPIHILWINLVTDGLPGLALTSEPEDRAIMRRPPRPPDEGIFAQGMALHIAWVGLLMGGLTLVTQAWTYHTGHEHWQTMVFTVLCVTQLGHAMAIRSERDSLLTLGLFSNRPLLLAVSVTFLAQMATIYVPALSAIFKTQPLSAADLAATLVISSGVFVAVEIEKWVKRRSSRSKA